jgi:ABC-2 type transport system permease protein
MQGAEITTAWLTVRQLLAGRRGLAVLVLALLPVAVAALSALRDIDDAVPFLLQLYDSFLIRIVLPIIALIFGTGAFGAEREDGTAVYLLTKPVARWRIAMTKLATAAVLTVGVVAASALLTGVVALGGVGGDRVVLGFTVGAAYGGVLYAWLFVALGLLVRRAIVAGVVYVMLWEAAAAGMFAGTRALSIRQYALSVADHLVRLDPTIFSAPLPVRTALIMGAVVLAVACILTIRRLGSFEIVDQR